MEWRWLSLKNLCEVRREGGKLREGVVSMARGVSRGGRMGQTDLQFEVF